MSATVLLFLSKTMKNFAKKKINRIFVSSFSFIFLFQHEEQKSIYAYADVLSHVREFTVHREEEEEDRGGGV